MISGDLIVKATDQWLKCVAAMITLLEIQLILDIHQLDCQKLVCGYDNFVLIYTE